jgi:two-component system, OmpR family, alkaline phosphatase synthesis response regulator PhoP
MAGEPKRKILLVDDEPDIVSMTRMRLEASGYEVFTASDGQEGYGMAKEQKPDLLILDLMLPKMDGFQVCRMLKSDEHFRNIPIIMLTAKSQKEDKDYAQKLGVDFFLTKPYEAKELLDKIAFLLKKGQG